MPFRETDVQEEGAPVQTIAAQSFLRLDPLLLFDLEMPGSPIPLARVFGSRFFH